MHALDAASLMKRVIGIGAIGRSFEPLLQGGRPHLMDIWVDESKNLKERASSFTEFICKYGKYPLWRHPNFKQLQLMQLPACLEKIRASWLLLVPFSERPCKLCSCSHDIELVSEENLTLAQKLNAAIILGDFDNICWSEWLELLRGPEACQALFWSCPLALYPRTFPVLFDLNALGSWELTVLLLTTGHNPIRVEFLRQVVCLAMGSPTPRSTSLLLRTLCILLQSESLPRPYSNLLTIQLAAELKVFCLERISDDAKLIYSFLS